MGSLLADFTGAFYDALVEALDVQVSYGEPANIKRESVWIGDTPEWSQEWKTLGAGTRDEEFTIDLFIQVNRPADSQRDATERAVAILADIESLLRGQVGVPDAVFGLSAHARDLAMVPRSEQKFLTDEGCGSLIRAAVHVQARI